MVISNEIKQKHQLIKLRSQLNDYRNIWHDHVIKCSVKKMAIQATSKRSVMKTLYFVERDDWSNTFLKKVKYLKSKVDLMGYKGAKIPRGLWLPTVIEHVESIRFVIYQAKSTRKLTTDQLRAFAKKYNYESLNPEDSYFANYLNGRDCKIQVKYNNRTRYYKFTDWAICLYDSKLPKIRKQMDKTLEKESNEPILLIN